MRAHFWPLLAAEPKSMGDASARAMEADDAVETRAAVVREVVARTGARQVAEAEWKVAEAEREGRSYR